MKWYLKGLKNYAKFEGRARRKEFWMFSLFNVIACFVLLYVGNFIGGFVAGLNAAGYLVATVLARKIVSVLITIYLIAIFIPSYAVGYRRIQDTGKSGKWVWLNLIPLIGAIILVSVFFCKDSEAKDNQYGPNPKATLKE
ncbi:DUF805 domain-containing protein [Bacillus sp. WMMC1349]|uniref:DUF805 domain-containing protein n=1 Tax=Bacillus sp. WMMC1349 TaxID=2736254 RepID=UPI0015517718|nr:DUF805 domain-containing protein [Bacillus sp. WMMC1349]NPC92023.1 DUF805 domain-containing protein [Bacillus sp. WMMC1349]